MPATNGSAHAFRSRRGLMVCCLAAVLLVSALFTSTAGAAKAKKPPKPKQFYYLALGDSISYGYSLVRVFENKGSCKTEGPAGTKCEPPAAFEPNFVSYFATKVPKHAKTTTVNLSCPGETSSGLIGHSVTLGGGPGAAFNPCGWHNGAGFRRHFEYGTESQLEAAIKLSQEKPAAVTAVTLQIGSNDELAVLGACQNKAYREAHGYGNSTECAAGEAPALFTKIVKNMGQSIGTLRALGGYKGPIVVLGFYNPYAILQPGTDALQKSLNEAVEFTIAKGEFGPRVKYANPFSKFNPVTNEKAALESFTEFYNPFAIQFNRIKIVEEHEASELAAIVAFQEASGKPNLAEAIAFTEAFGQPPILPNLAETIAAHEAAELPAIIAAQEAAKLAAIIAAQEAANLAAVIAAQEAANLAAVTAAQEPAAKAAYIAACEAETKTTLECEEKWASEGKAQFESAVKTAFDAQVKEGFDKQVKEGFDKQVKEGFDKQVKEGFDKAVKQGYDATVKAGYDAEVKRVFTAEVTKGFEAAGSPGDIHPSATGYEELGKMVTTANKGL